MYEAKVEEIRKVIDGVTDELVEVIADLF